MAIFHAALIVCGLELVFYFLSFVFLPPVHHMFLLLHFKCLVIMLLYLLIDLRMNLRTYFIDHSVVWGNCSLFASGLVYSFMIRMFPLMSLRRKKAGLHSAFLSGGQGPAPHNHCYPQVSSFNNSELMHNNWHARQLSNLSFFVVTATP